MGRPIIIVPAAPSAKITMLNVKAGFLDFLDINHMMCTLLRKCKFVDCAVGVLGEGDLQAERCVQEGGCQEGVAADLPAEVRTAEACAI